ncbi:hypothetical protein HanRHA438_Chr17g0830391 [Helianthus annuus]|nr:hypothetical protein HanRHA438_Chr17g0830391 [Helianthus annuus]
MAHLILDLCLKSRTLLSFSSLRTLLHSENVHSSSSDKFLDSIKTSRFSKSFLADLSNSPAFLIISSFQHLILFRTHANFLVKKTSGSPLK